MILFLSIIGLAIVILSIIDIFGNFVAYSPLLIITLIVGAVLIQIALDGLFAFIVHLMPNKWFEIDNKFYNVSNKERKFYEKIKIRKWKDKILELGTLGGFSKKSLKSSNDKEYLKRFIVESNKGVLTHIIGCFVGFLLIPIYLPFSCILSISLPVAIINFFMNLPSLFILRYNTPKLMAGYKRLTRTSESKLNKETSSQNEIDETALNKSVISNEAMANEIHGDANSNSNKD